MVDVKDAKAASAQAVIGKKHRRGVSNETKAVSQLKFHEKDAAQNGLFIGHLEAVTVDWSVNADGKAFSGMKVPRLTFHFESNHQNASERRHVYQTLFPQESNVDTIPGGSKAWQVDNVLNWIKHVLDVYYLKGREMTEEEEALLDLPLDDTDDNGEYVSVEPEDVIAAYTSLFTNTANLLNGEIGVNGKEPTHKPYYKTEDGKFISTWLKLIRYKKVKNEWRANSQNGDLAFDSFIGAGAIELVRTKNNATMPPVRLRLDTSRESITPKEVKKEPTIGGINGVVGGAGTVSVGVAPMENGNGVNTAYTDAASDMPF